MTINYNVNGSARKALVNLIAEFTGAPVAYAVKGTPTLSYQVGEYNVDKNGVLTGADNRALVDFIRSKGWKTETVEYDEPVVETTKPKHKKGIMDTLVEALNEDGVECKRMNRTPQMECGDGRWRNLDGTFTSAESNTSDTLTIEFPFGKSDRERENLRGLLAGKATLIKAALGDDFSGDLSIEFTEERTVKFEWLKSDTSSEVIGAWSAFLITAAKFSKKAQRVNSTDSGELGDNPKFDFRVFCVRLGLNGAEFREVRKTLLTNLPGDSAFKNAEVRERWNAKHTKKGGGD